MKKILMSLLTIALVGALITGGTMAYFSDIETKTNNTFTAGTIDISVSPASGQAVKTLPGLDATLKPSETGYITFDIHNVGTNPVVLWKHIGNVDFDGGAHPESEWDEDPDNTKNRIDKVIEYDLEVGGEVIFTLDDALTVRDIKSMWMPIGRLAVNETITVRQSYHMRADTGNWAQGDVMTFDIDIYAEQLLGNGPNQLSKKLFLDNKTGDWDFIVDDTWGILTWGSTADFVAHGLQPNTDYALITYTDPWPGFPARKIAHGGSDSNGNISWSGLSLPSGFSGKVWLVLKADYNETTKKMTGWNPSSYLFEANKVNFP